MLCNNCGIEVGETPRLCDDCAKVVSSSKAEAESDSEIKSGTSSEANIENDHNFNNNNSNQLKTPLDILKSPLGIALLCLIFLLFTTLIYAVVKLQSNKPNSNKAKDSVEEFEF